MSAGTKSLGNADESDRKLELQGERRMESTTRTSTTTPCILNLKTSITVSKLSELHYPDTPCAGSPETHSVLFLELMRGC